jgi:3-methylcrotonyl-CoA carboxylase alpha subunit
MRRALDDTAILGVGTNLGFLARIAAHPGFASAELDTGFIERHRGALIPQRRSAPEAALAAAAVSRLAAREAAATAAAARSDDRFSPWARIDGWRLDAASPQEVSFRDGTETRVIGALCETGGWRLRLGDREVLAGGEPRPDGSFSLMLDGVYRRVIVLEHAAETAVFIDGEEWRLIEIDPLAPAPGDDPTGGRSSAPMPGRVTQLMVAVGDVVRRGDPMIVIEAMKMEHTVAAPADGVVEAVRYAVGDPVEEGAELITLAAPEPQGPI